MSRKKRIISLLTQALNPVLLELEDESARHEGHAGARPEGETHYRLVIASERFKGMSPIQRHQMIYRLLDQEFRNGLHALSIEARAPE